MKKMKLIFVVLFFVFAGIFSANAQKKPLLSQKAKNQLTANFSSSNEVKLQKQIQKLTAQFNKAEQIELPSIFANKSFVNKESVNEKSKLKAKFEASRAKFTQQYPQEIISFFWTGNSWESFQTQKITYNENGFPSEIEFYDPSGSELLRKSIFTYDELNRLTNVLTQQMIAGNFENEGQMRTEYDELGNEILIVYEMWFNNTWNISWGQKKEITYQNNLPTEIIYSYFNNVSWEDEERQVNEYQNQNVISTTYYFKEYSENWEPETLENYSYSNNQINTITVEFWDGEQWETSFKGIDIEWFEFNGNVEMSELKSAIIQLYKNDTWGNYYNYDIQRDDIGGVVEIDKIWENDQWQNAWRAEIETDQNGNVIQTYRQIWNGLEWVTTNLFGEELHEGGTFVYQQDDMSYIFVQFGGRYFGDFSIGTTIDFSPENTEIISFGEFHANHSQVVFVDEEGSICNTNGTYNYTNEMQTIAFEAVSDNCGIRNTMLSSGMFVFYEGGITPPEFTETWTYQMDNEFWAIFMLNSQTPDFYNGEFVIAIASMDDTKEPQTISFGTFEKTENMYYFTDMPESNCQTFASYSYTGGSMEEFLQFTVDQDDCQPRVEVLTAGTFTLNGMQPEEMFWVYPVTPTKYAVLILSGIAEEGQYNMGFVDLLNDETVIISYGFFNTNENGNIIFNDVTAACPTPGIYDAEVNDENLLIFSIIEDECQIRSEFLLGGQFINGSDIDEPEFWIYEIDETAIAFVSFLNQEDGDTGYFLVGTATGFDFQSPNIVSQGFYTMIGSQIIMVDVENSTCSAGATYSTSLDEGLLTFTKIIDFCAEREAILTGGAFQTPVVDKINLSSIKAEEEGDIWVYPLDDELFAFINFLQVEQGGTVYDVFVIGTSTGIENDYTAYSIGTYETNGNEMLFTDQMGSQCTTNGLYNFYFNDNELIFNIITDDCSIRSELLLGGIFKPLDEYEEDYEEMFGLMTEAYNEKYILTYDGNYIVEKITQVYDDMSNKYNNLDKEAYSDFANIELSNQNDILSFAFETLNPVVNGVIDVASKTVDILVPSNTDVTALVATFALSEFATAQVNGLQQVSGQTANNFSNPAQYIITAQDGSTAEYTVTVTIQPDGIQNTSLNFDVFPNPVHNNLYVTNESTEIQTINIYTISGQLVMQISNINSKLCTLNLSTLESGSYLLQLQTSQGATTKLIMKN